MQPSEEIIAQTISEGIALGLSETTILKAIQLAANWVESYNDSDNEASVLPGIYDSQPGWDSVAAPLHIRVRYSSLEPGAVSQYAVFSV